MVVVVEGVVFTVGVDRYYILNCIGFGLNSYVNVSCWCGFDGRSSSCC